MGAALVSMNKYFAHHSIGKMLAKLLGNRTTKILATQLQLKNAPSFRERRQPETHGFDFGSSGMGAKVS